MITPITSTPKDRLPEIFKIYARFFVYSLDHLIQHNISPLETGGNLTEYSSAQSYSQFASTLSEGQKINAHSQFMGNASRCIPARYAIPFIVIPYMF